MKPRMFVPFALAASLTLASCAPTVTGPSGSYKPNVVTGWAYTFSSKVPVEQITDQTPDTTYATFPSCSLVAVSVIDVRKLGAEAAEQVCRQTDHNQVTVLGGLGIVAVAAGIVLVVILAQFFKAVSDTLQHKTSAPGTP